VIDRELPIPTAHEQFHETGRLSDAELEGELVTSLTALTDAMQARAARQAAAS
jgi:hypothetical protein